MTSKPSKQVAYQRGLLTHRMTPQRNPAVRCTAWLDAFMITQETASAIWSAYREIEAAEKILSDMAEERAKPFRDDDKFAPTLKDVFGRGQHLQLGIPSGSNGHRLFQVRPELAESVIRAHIGQMKAKLIEDGAVVCKELLGGFVATQKQYPSGLEYLEVTHGKTVLGTCCIQPSGGFIVWGKRKPVPTVRAAVLQMLEDHLNECRKEETKWRKKLAHFTSTNPPNGELSDRASKT